MSPIIWHISSSPHAHQSNAISVVAASRSRPIIIRRHYVTLVHIMWSAVWLRRSVERKYWCMTLSGVPQTTGPISAASTPKLTILWGRLEEILLLNKFFFRLSIRVLVAKIWSGKVVRWCPDGDFWASLWVLYFQRADSSTFQTCILNSH